MLYDLNDYHNKRLRKQLRKRLSSRGLILITNEYVEAYENDEHMIWICLTDRGYVALYPKAVYEIDSPSDWLNVEEDKLFVISQQY